jgi:hypothetical protein
MINTIHITNIHSNKIHKYESINNGNLYKVLYYDEEMLCIDDIETGRYRSVVVSMPEHKIIAFAPPKTITFPIFKKKNPCLKDIVIHEYIDGIMLQVFYDNKTSGWRLNSVVLNNIVFNSGLDSKAFIIATHGNIEEPFSKLAILDYFPKNYSYTFIIKKQPSFQSSLYLISVYKLCNLNQIIYVPQQEYENWPEFSNLSGIICFPKQCIIKDSYSDLLDDIQYDYNSSKWVLTNIKSGMQTTLSTNIYKLNKQITRIDKPIIFQYLCLQRIYKDYESVSYLTKKTKDFYSVKQLYDWFIRTIHEIYIKYYIIKTGVELPIKYKSFIKQIHQDYYIYPKKHNQRKIVKKQDIKDYFDKKHPWELLTILSCDISYVP